MSWSLIAEGADLEGGYITALGVNPNAAEQIAIGFEMWEFARTLILNALRSEHPDWSDERILEETARRMSA